MINRFSNLICELNDNKPLSIVRLGNVEATQMLKDKLHIQIETNAGFFGDLNELKKWKKKIMMALLNAHCNLRVITCNSFFVCDDVLTKLNIFIPTLPYIEDISFWITLLNNIKTNKIGFVSYFTKDMERQRCKLQFIHKKQPIKVSTKGWKFIKSENTIKGNEPEDRSWEEVYDDLLKRTLEAKCDVYFLSCGCYGVPLCEDLRKNGKKAVYVGGFLQLLFGIKGKRWADREMITQHYNNNWIFPTEKPKNSEQVEGWCYGE